MMKKDLIETDYALGALSAWMPTPRSIIEALERKVEKESNWEGRACVSLAGAGFILLGLHYLCDWLSAPIALLNFLMIFSVGSFVGAVTMFFWIGASSLGGDNSTYLSRRLHDIRRSAEPAQLERISEFFKKHHSELLQDVRQTIASARLTFVDAGRIIAYIKSVEEAEMYAGIASESHRTNDE